MRVIHHERLQEFIALYSDAASSLRGWLQIMEGNHFKNPVVLKQTIGSADYVKPYWVFNISGNKYRLIALIDFSLGIVSIEEILTHSQYDKGKWKKT